MLALPPGRLMKLQSLLRALVCLFVAGICVSDGRNCCFTSGIMVPFTSDLPLSKP